MTKIIQAGQLFDWASVESGFQTLLEEDLTPERIPQWLLEWSRLNDIVSEAFAAAHVQKIKTPPMKQQKKTTCI